MPQIVIERVKEDKKDDGNKNGIQILDSHEQQYNFLKKMMKEKQIMSQCHLKTCQPIFQELTKEDWI